MGNTDLMVGFIVVMLLPLLFLLLAYKVKWCKSEVLFNTKKAIDCVAYSMQFIFLAYMNYMITFMELPVMAIIVPVVESIFFSLYALSTFTRQFLMFERSSLAFNKKVFPFILASLLVGVLMAMSTINYAIYIFWPDFYEIPAGMSFTEIVFEFVYYSFTLAVTYSSGSITVAHVVTKLIQMIEICYCYILIGSVIVQLIERLRQNKETENQVSE